MDGRRDGDGPRPSGAAALGRPVPSRVDLHGARTAAAGELPRSEPLARRALAGERGPLGRRRARARPSGGPQVFWRRIDRLVDPETAFVRLYGERRFAYWLDSSLVSDGLSRFSYIGASGGPLSRVVSYDAARRRVRARGRRLRPHARREHLQLSRARAGRPGLRRRGRAVRPRGRLRRLLRLRGQGGLRIAVAPPLAVAGRTVHPVRSADRLRPPRGPHLCRLSRAQRGRRPPLDGADGARAAGARAAARPGRPGRRGGRVHAPARALALPRRHRRMQARDRRRRELRDLPHQRAPQQRPGRSAAAVPRVAQAQSGAARRLPAVRRT